MTFSPDGGTLLESSSGKLVLYEVATGRERMEIIRPDRVDLGVVHSAVPCSRFLTKR